MFAETGARHFTMLLFIAASVTGFACSEPTPADPSAGMRELYFLSDAKATIGDFTIFVSEAIAQQRAHLTDDQFETAMRVVHDQLSAEKIEQLVVEQLENRTEREYLDETLDWLHSPLGTRAMRVERVSWTSQGMSKMIDFMREREAHPPSAQRLELIQRYDAASHLSDLNAEAMLFAAYGGSVTVDAVKPEAERLGPEKLLISLDSQRQLLKPVFEETTAITTQFAFRHLADEELEAYVTFCESDAGQWFTGTLSATLIDVIHSTTEELANNLVAALSRQPSS